jgi:hypothetical protein
MVSNHPEDVEGECNAWCLIGDDFGDNDCTFRCKLPAGHEGWHEEQFGRHGDQKWFRWEKDARPAKEADEEQWRGRDDARDVEPVPHEPGEHYLAGFCAELEDVEYGRKLRNECAADAKRAMLLSCQRPECDDECPARQGCERTCRTCGETAEIRCSRCRLWFCREHESYHWEFCAARKEKRNEPE